MTFEYWAEEWLGECAVAIPRTEPIYRRHLTRLGRHVGFMLISEVTGAMLARALVDEHACQVSRRTLAETWQTGRRFCRWAQRRGVIDSNPFDSVIRPRPEWHEAPILSAEQLRQLLIAWPLTWNGASIVVAATTGARMGELIALTWDDLDGSTLRVRKTLYRSPDSEGERWRTGSPKSRAANRTIWLPGWVSDVLAFQRRRVGGGEWVFPAPRGGMWRHDGPRRALVAMLRLARVPRITFHGLRHSFATVALAGGCDVYTLSRALGHTDPGFTLRQYGHAVPERLEALAHRIGDALDPVRR